ncbi:MAG: DUF4872 domain-containing protein [Spirochaetia bacterium]|jgi:hypothetical protein
MMEALKGFRHFETHHCVTGSMRHIYAFNGHDLSEDLLLGLGEGVGFAYFHFKGQLPFLGGRAQPKPSMEEIAGERTGVIVRQKGSSSDAAAQKALLSRLEAGEPVMLQVDMGCLPYFDFGGQEYHFGGHVIVACGVDQSAGTVLVADREGPLHPVPLTALSAARGSKFKPFPPGRASWAFDFSGFRGPRADEVLLAITHQAQLMLSPPIANIGVKGIRKAAAEIARWDTLLDLGSLRGALFNAWIFISATGGTGGGAFRRMFSRFLTEAAAIAGRTSLAASGSEFAAIARDWDAVASDCHAAAEEASTGARTAALPRISAAVARVADREEAAWRTLADAVR